MVLVETQKVSGEMKKIGQRLNGIVTGDKDAFNGCCRSLATAMAESMAETAKMTYKEFAANQFKYRSHL